MAETIIQYDRELPEIPNRCAWQPPDCHLVKNKMAEGGWEVKEGRRPSELLLVPAIREQVNAWRDNGYPGASEVTKDLFRYWFEEDHEIPGFDAPFHYHFCQREAIETLAWLVEIAQKQNTEALIKECVEVKSVSMLSTPNIKFQTTQEDKRQMVRRESEHGTPRIYDMPPDNLRRYAFKMATGSGKTWVMAMAIVWSYFHKRRVEGSPLSTNFLIVAPNVIVYQRLERDFANGGIFNEIPLIPPEWQDDFRQKIILRGEAAEPDASGNLFLTNVQQLYGARDEEGAANPVEGLLGKKPTKADLNNERPMLERVKSLSDVIVINDEAHHVHDDKLAWNKSLLAIHGRIPNGLAAWLDFSATPKDQGGMYFPWTVIDYPLAQAVEDRIVKVPIIVGTYDENRPEDPDKITQNNVVDKYRYWIQAAVERWREHNEVYEKHNIRPVLFIMAERNAYADKLGEYLRTTNEFKEKEVLVIHADDTGEITKKELEKARQAARDIDSPKNKIKVIISVMMLREGWDVRNVSVVLGLRPFTAKAEILPEQVVGRGLRLMKNISPDKTQPLEVLGTQKLLQALREQLESDGVGVGIAQKDPVSPVTIEPIKERNKYDIVIPITKPMLSFQAPKLEDLKVENLKAIYEGEDIAEEYRLQLKLEYGPTGTEVSSYNTGLHALLLEKIISDIANGVMKITKLTGHFSKLCPIVEDYIANRCFGGKVDITDGTVRSHLSRLEMRDGIANYLAREIAALLVQEHEIEFEKEHHHLSSTKPFTWRRDLPPPLELKKTVFNYVATYNKLERRFAEFLDSAEDVARFAALGTTEQGGSGAQFRVDYIKAEGAIGFYYPDWVVVQKTKEGEVNWIIETKGRVWVGTELKDYAMKRWCELISRKTGRSWRYMRVNQTEFDLIKPTRLQDLLSIYDNKIID